MSIGDVNSQERGSGARYNDSKPDLSLIPVYTLYDEARVWMHGRKKYAAWNWAKGMDWSVPLACALRHLAAWQRGEDLDQESGLPHLAHAMCNLRMLTLYADVYPEGDDRPKKWLNRETVTASTPADTNTDEGTKTLVLSEELMSYLHDVGLAEGGDIKHQLDWGIENDNDGWIVNTGVAPDCELVEVKFVCGETYHGPTRVWTWRIMNDQNSITHYRVIKPSSTEGWSVNTGVAPDCELVEVRFIDDLIGYKGHPRTWAWDLELGAFAISHYRVIR